MNRMDGYSFDAAGDLLNDGAHAYAYNAEGQRAVATAGGVNKRYLRDLDGNVVAEIDNGVWARGEVYAGGRRWATYYNSTTYSNYSDWLGTVRVNTQLGGGWTQTCVSLPFGDGQLTTSSTIPRGTPTKMVSFRPTASLPL